MKNQETLQRTCKLWLCLGGARPVACQSAWVTHLQDQEEGVIRVKKKTEEKKKRLQAALMETVPIPSSFKCPIINEIMADPVVTWDGHVYERYDRVA